MPTCRTAVGERGASGHMCTLAIHTHGPAAGDLGGSASLNGCMTIPSQSEKCGTRLAVHAMHDVTMLH